MSHLTLYCASVGLMVVSALLVGWRAWAAAQLIAGCAVLSVVWAMATQLAARFPGRDFAVYLDRAPLWLPSEQVGVLVLAVPLTVVGAALMYVLFAVFRRLPLPGPPRIMRALDLVLAAGAVIGLCYLGAAQDSALRSTLKLLPGFTAVLSLPWVKTGILPLIIVRILIGRSFTRVAEPLVRRATWSPHPLSVALPVGLWMFALWITSGSLIQ